MSQNHPEVKTCGRCGKTFDCFSKVGGCWCEKLPSLAQELPGQDCLCPECLKQEIQRQQVS